jgi:hypothetical protein
VATMTNYWAPVVVHVGTYACPKCFLPADALQRKRQGIWNNEPRNVAIAAIATAVATGDLQSLWTFGLFNGRQYTTASVPFLGPGWLTVVVEGLEHAGELRTHLNLPISQAFPPSEAAWEPHSIVTLAFIQSCDYFQPTVVINAVGGRYALDLPAGFSARPEYNPAAIIEFDDAFDERAVSDTTQRLTEYGCRRWPIYPERRLGFDPAAIPTRSRAAKSRYQQRAERWRRAAEVL